MKDLTEGRLFLKGSHWPGRKVYFEIEDYNNAQKAEIIKVRNSWFVGNLINNFGVAMMTMWLVEIRVIFQT